MPAQVKNTTITLTDHRRFTTTLQMNSQHCYSYYTTLSNCCKFSTPEIQNDDLYTAWRLSPLMPTS